jgi:hypothetical protein
VFLLVVYLLTMRVRLIVDVGNLSAQRGSFSQADRLYALALRLWPDSAGRLVVQVNQGVSSSVSHTSWSVSRYSSCHSASRRSQSCLAMNQPATELGPLC